MDAACANIFMARIENQILRERVVLNHTQVTRGFFLGAAGCFGFGCRPTYLWPKAEVTKAKPGEKHEKKGFSRGSL